MDQPPPIAQWSDSSAFRSAFDHAPIAMILADVEGRCIIANQSCCRMLGYMAEEMAGISFASVTHPDDQPASLGRWRALLDGRIDDYKVEKRYVNRRGQILWVEASATVVRDPAGQPLYVIGQVQDITPLRTAERAQQSAEERYRAIIEDQTELICRAQAGGILSFVNSAYCRFFGQRREDLIGHTFMPLIPSEDQPLVEQAWRSISAANPVVVCEHRVIRCDRQIRWVQWTNHAIIDAEGRLSEIQSVGQDVTERKQVEMALKDSREQYRRILEITPELISVAVDGRIAFINSTGASLLGAAAPAQIIGRPVLDFVHPDSRPAAVQHLAQLAEPGNPVELHEETWQRLDGSPIDVEVTALPLSYEGRPGALVVARDITHRKRAEAAEQQQRSLAKALHDTALVAQSMTSASMQQRALAEALRDTAAALAGTLEFDEVLDRVLQNLHTVVPHDGANIALLEPPSPAGVQRDWNAAGAWLRTVRSAGYGAFGNDDWIRQLRIPVPRVKAIQRIIETGQPLAVEDCRLEPEWDSWPENAWVRSFVGAPIIVRGEVVGLLNLDSATPAFFQRNDANRLKAFADQAALAIYNANLYAATRRGAERMTLLYQAGTAFSQTESAEELHDEIVRWMRQLVGAQTAALVRVDSLGKRSLVATHSANQDAAAPEQAHPRSAVSLPLLWEGRLIGALSVTNGQHRSFSDDDLHSLTLFATVAAAAIEQRQAVIEAHQRESEARALTAQLARAREDERSRIAEQLHDTIGHHLAALGRNTETVRQALGDDPRRADLLNDNLALIKESQGMIQSLALDLDSKVLDEVGVGPAARHYVDRLSRTTGLRASLHIGGRAQRLPAAIERVILRGLKEALTNVIRHARVDRASAQIHIERRWVRLTVEDGGVGFDPHILDEKGERSIDSFGLASLRRQVQMVNGIFTVDSAPGQGTTVVLEIPFGAGAPANDQVARVLLADSHEVTRRGLKAMLSDSGRFECIEARDGQEAVYQAEILRPDLALINIQLPGLGGIEVTRQIVSSLPRIGIALLASEASTDSLDQAFSAGARGYLLKSDDEHCVFDALKAILAGGTYVSSSLLNLWDELRHRPIEENPLYDLTHREREVLDLVLAGYRNREIAEMLQISVRTAEVHRKNIMNKLDIRSMAQLLRLVSHTSNGSPTEKPAPGA